MSLPPYPRRALPQRKGMAIASLVLGILSIPSLGGLGIGALTGLVLGIVALVRANKEPAVYGGKGLAIGGIVTSALAAVMLPFVGIFAAIAIPSLLKARVAANESAAIGDIRTVISAQMAYQSINGGLYDARLECLSTPSHGCSPGATADAPPFLDTELASLAPKNGYERRFQPGPPPLGLDAEANSPSSVTSFAYVAVPLVPGQTGTRAFCGDSTGIVCFTADGREPETTDRGCDLSSCTLLQ